MEAGTSLKKYLHSLTGGEADEVELYVFQSEFEIDEYFAPVRYHGGLQYAECEVEQANYHLNHLLNGFTTNAIVNFNNGVPSAAERRRVVKDFVATKTGSRNAGKPFIAFNDSTENAVTIASYDIPDPHRQYEFINNLSEKKILLSHNVSSPLLLGIRDTGGGLGSNANEIREAYTMFREMVLEPLRNDFLDGLMPILLMAGINEAPTFEDLDIFHTDEPAMPAIPSTVPPVPNMELSEVKRGILTGEDEKKVISALSGSGEVMTEEYEILNVADVGDSDEENDYLKSMAVLFNTTPADGEAQDASSEGDSGLFKVRYRYAPNEIQEGSRELCKYLILRRREGVVYRKEEIDSWQGEGVNEQFAPRGSSSYSLWEWKGGAYCHHKWQRVVYFRRRNADGSFLPRSSSGDFENDRRSSVAEAKRREVPNAKLEPDGWDIASKRPIDTPNRGKLN